MALDLNGKSPFSVLAFSFGNIFVLTKQIEALTKHAMQTEIKRRNCKVTEILEIHNFDFALYLNGKSSFSVLSLQTFSY